MEGLLSTGTTPSRPKKIQLSVEHEYGKVSTKKFALRLPFSESWIAELSIIKTVMWQTLCPVKLCVLINFVSS